MATLKVSSTSEPKAAAGALANTIREQGWAEIQVIGPKAVNQAVKAIAIARGYIAPSGIDLVAVPSFTDVIINGEEKTAIRIVVKPRYPVSQFQQSQQPIGTGAAGEEEAAAVGEPESTLATESEPGMVETESELESSTEESGLGGEEQPGLNA